MTKEDIRSKMASKGLGKRELAEAIGVSVRTVEGWLSKRTPSKTAQKLISQLCSN